MHRYLISIVCALCAPLAVLAGAPLDKVLKHVPADTAFVVAVPSMQDLAHGVSSFGRAAGIEELADLTAVDILDDITAGHVAGLDPQGAFIYALRPGFNTHLLIGTLTDPQAWKAEARASAEDPDILTFTMGHKQWFAGHVGQVAILSPDEAIVREAVNADGAFRTRFAPVGGALLAGHQAVVWADVAVWRPFVEPLIMVAEGFMQMGIALSDPQTQGNVAIWRMLFKETRSLIAESETYAASFTFDPHGAQARDLLRLRTGGPIASYLSMVRTEREDPLRGLPGIPGMVVFGAEWGTPQCVPTFSEVMLQAMLATPAGRELLSDEELKAGIDATMEVYRQVTGYNGSMRPGDDGFVMTGLYLSEQPDKVQRNIHRALDTMASAKLMRLMSPQVSVDVSHRAETVRGTQADVYEFAFDSPDDQVREVLHAVYGRAPNFYLAAHDHGVAYAMGSRHAGRQGLVEMLDAGATRLAVHPRIVSARKTIRSDPQVSVYLDIPQLVEFGLDMCASMDVAVSPVTVTREGTPLVAFGIYLETAAMRSELFVPTAAIRPVLDAIDECRGETHKVTSR